MSGFEIGPRHVQRVSGYFLALGSQSALAQGITNPAGGGLIPVFIHILLGMGLLGYVFVALAIRRATGNTPAATVMIPLIVLYLIIGLTETYIADHQSLVLGLYLEMVLLAVGTGLLISRGTVSRVLAIGSVVALIGLLNFLKPKLIDFQTRIYVDNEKDMSRIAVSYPGHWREMHLEDGRVLLNINPHSRFGGSMRMIADANKIESPVTLSKQENGEQQMIFDVYNPVVTRGTWGWQDRPRTFFNSPLLGTVQVSRFEKKLAGKALLLNENKKVECRYLHEARGKTLSGTPPNGHVVWSIEGTVEDGSVVECRQ